MSRRHPYDDATDRELDQWPGVSAEREQRSTHMALVLAFGEVSRFVIYPLTPSDARRGVQNHLGTMRRVLREMGARRIAPTSGEPRQRSRPPTTTPKRIAWPERATGGPERDCWAPLRALVEGSNG